MTDHKYQLTKGYQPRSDLKPAPAASAFTHDGYRPDTSTPGAPKPPTGGPAVQPPLAEPPAKT